MTNQRLRAPNAARQAVQIGLARALDAGTEGLATLSRSRAATLVSAATLIFAVMALGRQEIGQGDMTVYDTPIGGISASMGGRYVRVTGTLDPARVAQTRARLGAFEWFGGTWVALATADGREGVWVSRDTLPAGARGTLTLVGRLALGTGQEPPIYLEVGEPPDILARDRLGRAGGLAALVVACGIIAAWLARRALYAIPLPAAAEAARPDTPPFVFFSFSLSGVDGPIRNAPVDISPSRLEAGVSGPGWRVAIRRVWAAQPLTVATRFGALPALRLRYEDARGLPLDAVIAARRREERDELTTALRHVGA